MCENNKLTQWELADTRDLINHMRGVINPKQPPPPKKQKDKMKGTDDSAH